MATEENREKRGNGIKNEKAKDGSSGRFWGWVAPTFLFGWRLPRAAGKNSPKSGFLTWGRATRRLSKPRAGRKS